MEKDSDGVHDALVWAHHRVVPNLFDMVHNACEFLCDRQNLDCTTVDMGAVTVDLDMLKVASLEHYIEMLDRARFDSKVTNQLLASMASYEIKGRKTAGLGALRDAMKLAEGDGTEAGPTRKALSRLLGACATVKKLD